MVSVMRDEIIHANYSLAAKSTFDVELMLMM
jgi:hypothetical protein